MIFKLTSAQLAQIMTLRNAAPTASEPYPIARAYELLKQWADNWSAMYPTGNGIDPNSVIWLEVAAQVNRGQGVFSDFIRNYTSHQHELRYGSPLTSQVLQGLSDQIGREVIDDVGELNALSGVADIPLIADIARKDATVTVQNEFGGDETAWSGVLLFPFLGDDTNLNLMLGGLDSTSAYQTMAAIGAGSHATGEAGILGIMQAIGQALLSLGVQNAPSTAAQVAGDITGFMQSAYGVGLFSVIASAVKLGKIDKGSGEGLNDTITTDGNTRELVHLGDGDDTLTKSGSVGDVGDVVDGGDGRDIYDASAATFEIELKSDNESYKNFRLLLEADFLPFGDEEVIVGFEELRLGQDEDEVDITLNAGSTLERLDTNQGDDEVEIALTPNTSFKRLDTGTGDDEVEMTGAGVAPGALEIRLGDGDDYLEAAPDGAVVYGGAGDDIFTPGQSYLIADPEEGDRVSYFGKVLTGGIRYKGSESPWAKGRNGDFYGLNSDGELVISDKLNNKTFVNDNKIFLNLAA